MAEPAEAKHALKAGGVPGRGTVPAPPTTAEPPVPPVPPVPPLALFSPNEVSAGVLLLPLGGGDQQGGARIVVRAATETGAAGTSGTGRSRRRRCRHCRRPRKTALGPRSPGSRAADTAHAAHAALSGIVGDAERGCGQPGRGGVLQSAAPAA